MTAPCRHLGYLDTLDSRNCDACVDARVDRVLDNIARANPPRTSSGETVAILLITLVVLGFMGLALVTGQQWQAERCELAATNATPCGTQVEP